jgi:hypothetical protein
VRLSVYAPIVVRQWLGKHVPAATKNCCSVVFYAVRETILVKLVASPLIRQGRISLVSN